MEYPNGRVMLTSTVKFASLVPADTTHALLSTYCLDRQWLFEEQLGRFHPFPLWLFLHSKTTENKTVTINHRSVHIVTPRFPPYMTYGVMHAKIILYRTPNFVRVIISSANLVPCDYEEGPMQNILYVQDFSKITCPEVQSEFYKDLNAFLKHLGGAGFIQFIENYDYSNCQHFKLVYSIPGTFTTGLQASGMEMLGRACRQLVTSEETNHDRIIVVQGSSLGKLPDAWLSDIKSKTGLRNPKLKIVFPTEQYALQYGIESMGTIFCTVDNWEKYSCKSLFHQCASPSPLHTKVFVFDECAWYLGSHNFTPAAWGRYTKAHDKLMINNYELGIVTSMSIPVPFKCPPDPYGPDDRPWMQELFYGQT